MMFLLVNVSNDAIHDIFAGFNQVELVTCNGALDWVISYTADSFGNTFTGGNDIALRAIPEPSAALLGGIGVLAMLRRRRHNAAKNFALGGVILKGGLRFWFLGLAFLFVRMRCQASCLTQKTTILPLDRVTPIA